MKSWILALIITLPLAGSARADDATEPAFWESVNLSDQFTPMVATQTGGTCHTFAAAALFDAACYRETGEHVHISEAVLYLRHLEKVWGGPLASWSRGAVQDPNADLDDGPALDLTGMDGGNPDEDLGFIMKGGVCVSEENFPFDKGFADTIEGIADQLAPGERAAIRQADADTGGQFSDPVYRARVDEAHHEAYAAALKALTDRRADYMMPMEPDYDSTISRCTNLPLKIQTQQNVSADDLKEILRDRRIPVNCNYYNQQLKGWHAVVVAGYKVNTIGTEFLIRDSNYSTPYWTYSLQGCSDITTLDRQ